MRRQRVVRLLHTDAHETRPSSVRRTKHRTRPMRILFLINTMGRGGAEVQVRDLALRLVQRGHSVAVVVLLPYEDFEAQLVEGGVATFSLGMTKGRPSIGALTKLWEIAKRFQPEVVHAHLFGAILLARLAFAAPRALLKRPVVVGTSHCPHEKTTSRYSAYRATARLSDAFTCVSRRGLEEHERHHAAKAGSMLYTPNGIDAGAFEQIGRLREHGRRSLGVGSAFTWLAIGSFRDEQKDYGTLLRAFASMGGADQLVVAGGGKLLSEKRSLASSLGIAERTHFLGLRADVPTLLASADAYVMSSAWEAMPIVLLEAAAARLPVIATDVGDVDQLIVSGETGFLVPRKDEESLRRSMMQLNTLSLGERRALGDRLSAHVKAKFDLGVVTARWEALYRGFGHPPPT